MKTTILLAATIALAAFTVTAQPVSTAAPINTLTIQSFPQTVEAYFTSFNTNFSWTNITLEVATGYKQVTGVNAASTLDAQYDFGSTKQWDVGAAFQFSGVGSVFNAYEAQIGYALVQHFDAKVEADLRVGYDALTKTAMVEPAVFVKKKLTVNTYAETGVSLPIEFKGAFNNTPTFFVEAGFDVLTASRTRH